MSTADSCLLSLGSLMARDLAGRDGESARDTRLGKLLAAGILIAMIPLALERDVTLWRLIELKMELLIQCVPAFLMGIHWGRQRADATLAGILIGTLFAVGLTLAGVPRLGGIHAGVLGLCLNAATVVVLTLARPTVAVRSSA
jgi:Na+/proline symporter